MYAVMGASGHIGHEIAKNLLGKGKQVRVICRSKDRVSDLIKLGAIPFEGDAHNFEFLTECFKGCEAIFCMIPPDYVAKNMRDSQNLFGEAIAKAIKASGCKKVVNLSSIGAEDNRPTGPIKGLYDQEQRLDKIKDVDIIHLRPTYFLENLLPMADLIKNQGILGTAIKENVPFYSIATKDIAEKATGLLLEHKFSGHPHQYLLGAKETNMGEITKKFGSAIGKVDLKYVQFSYDDAKAAMMGMGMSEDVANSMIELAKAANDGSLIKYVEKDGKCFTATTPEDFAKKYIKPLVA